MREKKNKSKILKPRVLAWKIKPEQIHRSKKTYSRRKEKGDLQEILKENAA